MTINRHVTETYKDGYRKVEFCVHCGAEGELLHLECIALPTKDDRQKEFFDDAVDNQKKPV